MLMAEAPFKPFNVETSNSATYKSFIESLRTRFVEISKRYSHNRPALPVQQNPPTGWFDMELKTKKHWIKLRFRLGNLYLDGYQMENSQQWLEFGKSNSNSHLIPGSNFLGFDGDYNSLAHAAGNDTIEGMKLGHQKLINAVNQLATKTEGNLRAQSLIVVIQMICESIRFFPISDRLTRRFHDPDGSKIVPWMLNLERSWGSFSEALLRADAYPEQSFQLPPNAIIKIPLDHTLDDTSNPTPCYKITTLPEAARVLRMLLGLIFYPSA